jgi:hypothetical protein
MAGTIICDYIRTDANQLSLNVGNTTFATINASGFFSNTGTQLIAANGKISGASLVSGSITSAAFATAANTIPRSSMTSGAVLQVVSVYTNGGYTSTTSTSYVATTLSASITPTSSASKFLIFFTGGVYATAQSLYAIHRNGSNILNNQIQTQLTGIWTTQAGVAYDTPATASAITYAVYMKATSGTAYWGGDTPLTNTLTIMEIA